MKKEPKEKELKKLQPPIEAEIPQVEMPEGNMKEEPQKIAIPNITKLDEGKTVTLGTPMVTNQGPWRNNLMVGTATTGLVRVEWMQRRYNQVIPTNWSLMEAMNYIGASMPMRFLVSDAQNIVVRQAIEKDAEWLWFIEHDNLLPVGAFLMMNKYMREKTVPVVSGLYFTKSVPPEPLLYRGDGHSFYTDWKYGDKVWVSGVPTGMLLIHMSIIRAMWNESPEYQVDTQVTRRVFEEPAKFFLTEDATGWRAETGTSDLNWCKRVIEGHYFKKAGWDKFDNVKYPFLVDTNLFSPHIDTNGRQFPLEFPKEYLKSGQQPPR